MSTLNLIFEQMERFVLAEPMAFELYRRVGNSACRTDFIRLTVDDEPLGYYLLCEQPNKAFLRENKLRDDGNLYKFGVGHVWWRMGGWFSRPLLANPTFRKLYLARVKEILEKDYTLEKWEPAFLALEERLREDVENFS